MTKESKQAVDLRSLADILLAALDSRSRDIVSRRYGLKSGTTETLESIGREYGITRERVRQIQAQACRLLRTKEKDLAPAATMFGDIFQEHGGILAESHVVVLVEERSGDTSSPTLTAFCLDILPSYEYISRDPHFSPHWRNRDLIQSFHPSTVEIAEAVLADEGHPVAEEKLLVAALARLRELAQVVPKLHIKAQLTASLRIQKTPFGEWGLLRWPETNPRGVGDKAYAVMRRHNKPEHFTTITQLINEVRFDYKKANAQTVHNELIKDKRFVLVGRGLYGLAEWGYMPGTVADVISALLTRAGRPLSREELIEKVMEQRQVKKNTILLGLQNQDRFVRTDEDHYTLKEA